MKQIDMNDVVSAKFMENESDITVKFKKTIQIRQYESEVIEREATIKITEAISGIERMLISEFLSLQLEYMAYTELYGKQLVSATEFETRRNELTTIANTIYTKASNIVGEDRVSKLLAIG